MSRRSQETSYEIDAPASSWGLIIGTKGETLKNLQQKYNVRIIVPRPNVPGRVRLSGSEENCRKCEEDIMAMVQRNARGKAKKNKPREKRGGTPFPGKCPLCESAEITGLGMAYDHIGGTKHTSLLIEKGLYTAECQNAKINGGSFLARALAILEADDSRAFHEQLGFDVDMLLKLAPEEEEKRQAAQRLKEEIATLPDDAEWLKVEREARFVVKWDDTMYDDSGIPILQAPTLDDMMERCILGKQPPLARVPREFPAPLPKREESKRKTDRLKEQHRHPAAVIAGRLGIAVALKCGLPLDSYDIVCGTSFIKALSGDSSRCQDTFYLERFGAGTICVLHVPRRFHTEDDVGHAVERLLCGASDAVAGTFENVTTASIDGTRFLVTSEIDAVDESGRVVELKSSSRMPWTTFMKPQHVLQIKVNGSESVLFASLDNDSRNVLGVEWISAKDCQREEAFINQGKRARVMLATLLAQLEEFPGNGAVLKLTFNEIRVPVLEPAGRGVEVVPHGVR